MHCQSVDLRSSPIAPPILRVWCALTRLEELSLLRTLMAKDRSQQASAQSGYRCQRLEARLEREIRGHPLRRTAG
jgi:hypothetical protein